MDRGWRWIGSRVKQEKSQLSFGNDLKMSGSNHKPHVCIFSHRCWCFVSFVLFPRSHVIHWGMQVMTRHPSSVPCHGIKDTRCTTTCKGDNCSWWCHDLSCICGWALLVALQLSLGAWETSTLASGDIKFQSVTVAASCETNFILDESGKGRKPPIEQLALHLWFCTWQTKKTPKKTESCYTYCQKLIWCQD